MSFTAIKNAKYLVVFESGAGNDHTVWTEKAVASQININFDVLMYDRAGYGYTSALPPLPNVPVIVLTSMQSDATHSFLDKQIFYIAHEQLKNGVTDFTHIATTKSGHFIMLDA